MRLPIHNCLMQHKSTRSHLYPDKCATPLFQFQLPAWSLQARYFTITLISRNNPILPDLGESFSLLPQAPDSSVTFWSSSQIALTGNWPRTSSCLSQPALAQLIVDSYVLVFQWLDLGLPVSKTPAASYGLRTAKQPVIGLNQWSLISYPASRGLGRFCSGLKYPG